MPNKKKNNSRYTGFYWYMQEIMPDLKREGRVHGGIDQVVPIARPMWKVSHIISKTKAISIFLLSTSCSC